jgi:hypothetical protein
MKFGKQFESYKIPEWFEYYFNYKGIKTVLKFLDNRPMKRKKLNKLKMMKAKILKKYEISKKIDGYKRRGSIFSNDSLTSGQIIIKPKESKKIKMKKKRILEAIDLSGLPDNLKISNFLHIYKDNINFIDQFFNSKLEEFTTELNNLENKMNFMDDSSSSSEDSLMGEIKSENDEMGYAVSWKRALSSIYNKTTWLHSYHSINSLAVLKITKKAKKIFKLYNIDISEELKGIKPQFSFFGNSLNKLVELRVRIRKLFSKKFNKGNDLITNKELEKRLHGGIKDKKSKLLYLFLGIFITLIFCYVIFKNIDGKNTNDSFKPFFPFFSFSYIIILCITLAGINMTIWGSYKINYRYLFELDPRNKITPNQIFEIVAGLAALWMFYFMMMKLCLKFGLFGGEYTLFPLLMNLSLVVILLLPFHIVYFNCRKGLVRVIIGCIFPIGKNTVRFKHFILGDIFITLAEPFKNLILGYCLMVCSQCYSFNIRGPCNRESIPCWIISVYPQFIRFTQCLNKFYYSRILWPDFGNVVKYFIRIINTSMGFFYERNKGKVRFYFRIFIGAISTTYNAFWDIYIDWGCGRKNNNNFFLREKITFPPLVYYIAIFYNSIIRGIWTWNFIPIPSHLTEWRNLLTGSLDIIRRGLWALIRIENESLSNPEQYRSFLTIPDLPMDN